MMLLALFRRLLLISLSLLMLSWLSHYILLRDPLNHFDSLSQLELYQLYVQRLLKGDFGISYATGEPIVNQLLYVLPSTLVLSVAASLLGLLFGTPLGFIAAYRRKTLLGKLLGALGSVSLAVPVFWLALIWLAMASMNQWSFSSVGELHPIYEPSHSSGFKLLDIALSDTPYRLKMWQSALHHLVLPTLVLAVPATLEIMRLTEQRASLVLKKQYVKVAVTHGWSPWRIWYATVLRNTLPALVPQLAHTLTLIFAFAMLIENIFSWQGIGRWLINALKIQDYNVISAGVMAIGIFVLLMHALADLLAWLLDPAKKKEWYS